MRLFDARARHSMLALFMPLAACAGDDPSDTVHRSAPPAVQAQPSTAPTAPQDPLGAGGPSAQIMSIRLASTGAPVSLAHITDAVNVLALVTRGRGSSPLGPARLELVLRGPRSATLVNWIATPVPLVIAHEFRLPVSDGDDGLPSGSYLAHVRVIGPEGWLIAQSTPVPLSVRGR